MITTDNRVLITGIQGFTGQYMASRLRNSGYEVFGELPSHNVDITSKSALRQMLHEVQPNYVIHLAALAFVGHGIPNDFYSVNLIGTRNLLEELADLKHTPYKILLSSSANIYGNTQEGILSENSLVNPSNDYAVSKLAMEYMARLWAQRLPIIITRPFNYTGVGQDEKFLIPKIIAHFRLRSECIELGNLDISRDFSDVRSIVSAYQGLLESDLSNQTINVCSGRSYSLEEIISTCQKITGHSLRITVNPDLVRTNEVKNLFGDASKLQKFIPEWKPIPLEETLRWMLQR